MATYGSDAILGQLHRMRRELWTNLARPQRRGGRQGRERDTELEDVTAAVYFVKRLAMKALDVRLLGEAELLRLETEDARDVLEGGSHSERALRATDERAPNVEDPTSYSSDDILNVLDQLAALDAQRRFPRGSDHLLGDWLAKAAVFVKLLAAGAKDLKLVGAAELMVLEQQKRDREREDEILRDEEQRRLDSEQAERRKWDAYEYVSNTQIGRHLKPPLAAREVRKLLNTAGLIAKNDANEWVFTAAGVEYGQPDAAKEGGMAPWASWSKSVLPVLQALLDRENEPSSPAPG